MQFRKKQIVVGLFLVVILVFLFTPVGFIVRVQVSRLLSSSAAIIKTEMHTPLDTYQWRLVDQKGNDFNFEHKKGEVIFINFWATWCPPCVAEMPDLQKLYDNYDDRVAFMFVANDNSERVTKFLIKKGYNIPVYYSKTKSPNVLTSKVLPTTYIINREGRIIVSEIGFTDWNSPKIRTLLEDLIKE